MKLKHKGEMKGWWGFSIFSTGDDEYQGFSLYGFGFGWWFKVYTKHWIKPCKVRVLDEKGDLKYVLFEQRNIELTKVKDQYTNHISGSVGLTEKGWNESDCSKHSFFKELPWSESEMTEHSLLNFDGSTYFTYPRGRECFGDHDAIEQKQEKKVFEIIDGYDGTKLEMEVSVERRIFRAGSGMFKWIRWFKKDDINIRIEFNYSDEVGREKGSWKGGTMGSSMWLDVVKNQKPDLSDLLPKMRELLKKDNITIVKEIHAS